MVSILKPSVSAKEEKPSVNPCEHSSVTSKRTALQMSLQLFCQRTHLAGAGGLGSVPSTEPGWSLGNLLPLDTGQFDIFAFCNQSKLLLLHGIIESTSEKGYKLKSL